MLLKSNVIGVNDGEKTKSLLTIVSVIPIWL